MADAVVESDDTITLKLVEPAVTAAAKIPSIMAGSMIEAIDISRLDPKPPNALAVSRPASARKNRPRVNKYTIVIMSLTQLNGTGVKMVGTKRAMARVEVKTT